MSHCTSSENPLENIVSLEVRTNRSYLFVADDTRVGTSVLVEEDAIEVLLWAFVS